jgi:hypothetical protein
MKKAFLGFIVASSLVMGGSFAQFGLGISKGDSSNSFITVFGGVNILNSIGVRTEYTKNISEDSNYFEEDVSRYGLFATYTLPLVAGFSITPKVGLVKTDGSFTVKETLDKVTDSSTNFTYGLEVNYQINDSFSAFVGYTDYGSELDIRDIDTSNMDTKNYTFGIKLDI